jgi:HK97 family phage prohead protease
MPYYIEKDNAQCKSGWAVTGAEGVVYGCHTTKASAIKQAVAISISTDEPFAGERAAIDSLEIGDYVSWNVLDPEVLAEVVMVEGEYAVIRIYEYEDEIFTASDKMMIINVFKLEKVARPEMVAEEMPHEDPSMAESDMMTMPEDRAEPGDLAVGDYVTWDSSGGMSQGRITRIVTDGEINVPDSSFTITGTPDDPAALIAVYEDTENGYESTDTLVGHKFSTLTKIEDLESRAINQGAPAYMRAAARRGLAYYEDGLGGDGLVEKTIREAREMASGTISDDKWIRIAAWISRHLGDLDSPNAQPGSDNYPSPGVVAHLLWGSGPSKRAAQRTLAYAESVVARIRADEESKRMTESPMDEARDKWVRAAWAIKANLEDLPEEARALGKKEVRTEHTDLEIRETGDGMTFEGYAAVFNSPSQPLPFIETIKPGAFKRSLQGRHRMMLLWNHNASEPLASTRNGTLKLVEDARGLKVTATLANTQTGRDVAELLRSGTIDAMSFGFQVKKDSWSADGNYRTLEEVAIHEVSLTSFPAYEGTAGTTSIREKRDIDADQLADSLMKLESGEELDPEQAKIISEVVAKLTKPEDVQEFDGDLLALKKKKLDLLMKEAV